MELGELLAPMLIGLGPKLPVVGSGTKVWPSVTETVPLLVFVEKMFSWAQRDPGISKAGTTHRNFFMSLFYTPSRCDSAFQGVPGGRGSSDVRFTRPLRGPWFTNSKIGTSQGSKSPAFRLNRL